MRMNELFCSEVMFKQCDYFIVLRMSSDAMGKWNCVVMVIIIIIMIIILPATTTASLIELLVQFLYFKFHYIQFDDVN